MTAWTRIRRLFWSWWPWAIGGLTLAYTGHWGWAAASGTLATVSFLIDSPGFLPTIAGVTNTAFSTGHSVDLLNNGDEFYPRMLEGY